ncbi:MAG TPA: hypothetical protein VE978_24625 [Chitinophagales bacterium]|nr:hypothetical protein [Chitinophagales bacterium]
MKILFTLISAFIFFTANAQTKILDSKLTTNKIILYCSDSLAVQVGITIGTTGYQSNNVLNTSYTIGTDLTFVDNDLTIPLSNLASGDYFVSIVITRADSSTQEMEFETSL